MGVLVHERVDSVGSLVDHDLAKEPPEGLFEVAWVEVLTAQVASHYPRGRLEQIVHRSSAVNPVGTWTCQILGDGSLPARAIVCVILTSTGLQDAEGTLDLLSAACHRDVVPLVGSVPA
jgi:hypothetical protein